MILLDDIIAHKKHTLKLAQEQVPLRELRKLAVPVNNRSFKGSISKKNINLIAELKKASPSSGMIRRDFNPEEIAVIYENSGAGALSVLTEDRYFQGNVEYLKSARRAVNLPVLRKDFIISEYQIVESAVLGVDAVLLIAALLDEKLLKSLYLEAQALGIEALVEVHDERELDKAMGIGAAIIGINNRNLKTFEIDLDTTVKLAPLIPREKIIVSESGIKNHADVMKLSNAGVKAVLIGTTFMKAADIGAEVKKVMGW